MSHPFAELRSKMSPEARQRSDDIARRYLKEFELTPLSKARKEIERIKRQRENNTLRGYSQEEM